LHVALLKASPQTIGFPDTFTDSPLPWMDISSPAKHVHTVKFFPETTNSFAKEIRITLPKDYNLYSSVLEQPLTPVSQSSLGLLLFSTMSHLPPPQTRAEMSAAMGEDRAHSIHHVLSVVAQMGTLGTFANIVI
jgi:hypothetical protein